MKKPNKRPRGAPIRKVRQHYGSKIIYYRNLRAQRVSGFLQRTKEWFLDAFVTSSEGPLADAHRSIFQP